MLLPASLVSGAANLLAPVSNGNISLMVDLARRNNLPWDAILGAEIARDYKPKPRVYLAAAEAFDLVPSDCMMVAAHPGFDRSSRIGDCVRLILLAQTKMARAAARHTRPSQWTSLPVA